jgi:hypothetical protein
LTQDSAPRERAYYFGQQFSKFYLLLEGDAIGHLEINLLSSGREKIEILEEES